jgi:hypothetical protein
MAACARGDAGGAEAFVAEFQSRRAEMPGAIDNGDIVWVATAAVGIGKPDSAAAVLVRRPWSVCGRLGHSHARALVAQATGRLDEAARLFREAADGWQAWGSVPFRAYALLGLGTCAGDSAALDEGEAIFAELGATPIGTPTVAPRQQQV